jgi:polyhydroxyalkanoate synthesis regulator phasin
MTGEPTLQSLKSQVDALERRLTLIQQTRGDEIPEAAGALLNAMNARIDKLEERLKILEGRVLVR